MAKLTATDIKVREIMHAGNEPAFDKLVHTSEDFATAYMKALNWIHNTVEPDQLRGELETLLKNRKAEADVAYVGDLDGVTLGTLGKIAYCVNRGAQLAPSSILRIRNALDAVRNTTPVNPLVVDVEPVREVTAADRINEAYKHCYSRIDNVKARMLNSKTELKDIRGEVEAILETHGGNKAQVHKRLVQHYNERLQEALGDRVLKAWVKPLQEIVKALGGDVKAVKERVKKVEAKAAKTVKPAARKPAKAVKPAARKVSKTNTTKTITIRPKREDGKPTIASQVRDLIRKHKAREDVNGMIEIVIRELGLTKERGRSVVKAFWSKVEV